MMSKNAKNYELYHANNLIIQIAFKILEKCDWTNLEKSQFD